MARLDHAQPRWVFFLISDTMKQTSRQRGENSTNHTRVFSSNPPSDFKLMIGRSVGKSLPQSISLSLTLRFFVCLYLSFSRPHYLCMTFFSPFTITLWEWLSALSSSRPLCQLSFATGDPLLLSESILYIHPRADNVLVKYPSRTIKTLSWLVYSSSQEWAVSLCLLAGGLQATACFKQPFRSLENSLKEKESHLEHFWVTTCCLCSNFDWQLLLVKLVCLGKSQGSTNWAMFWSVAHCLVAYVTISSESPSKLNFRWDYWQHIEVFFWQRTISNISKTS